MNQRCIATALWAALSLPAASMAGQPEAWEYLSNCACEAAPVAVTQPPADSAFGAPEGAARLEQARGGDAGIASDTRLTGTVTANTATNVATGSNINSIPCAASCVASSRRAGAAIQKRSL